MNGKGDSPRPKSVSAETFSERWEKAFRRSPLDLLEPGTHYIVEDFRTPEKEKP